MEWRCVRLWTEAAELFEAKDRTGVSEGREGRDVDATGMTGESVRGTSGHALGGAESIIMD